MSQYQVSQSRDEDVAAAAIAEVGTTSGPQPVLSIIIPHHNRPEMLVELLSTIPDRGEIEVIIVDDHSERQPVLDASRQNVRLVCQHGDERYAGSARNAGIEMARGDWIIFADSDDQFDTEALLRVLSILQTYEADLVYVRSSSFATTGGDGTRHHSVNNLLDRAAVEPECLVQFYPPWAKFIRRDLLLDRQVRFESTRVSNDVMFSALLYFAAQKVTIIPDVVYKIREGNPSLTSQVDITSIEERMNVLRRYNALLIAEGHRDWLVPAAGQLRKTLKSAPCFTARQAIRSWRAGQPILLTRKHLSKLIRRFS